MIAALALALALAAQDEQAPDATAEEEARLSRRLAAEYAELGFALDLERLGFTRLSMAAGRAELDAQQDALFDAGHFVALHAFCEALGLDAGESPAAFREATVDMLAAALLAFYDFRGDRMVFLDNPFAGLSSLEGLVAHELAHAWRDQQEVDVGDVLERHAETFEASNIAQCLLEGEAEVMSIALALARRGDTLAGKTPADLTGPLADALGESSAHLRYSVGRAFALERWQAGGWAAVDAALTAPPPSTEAILHPEKRSGDDPTPVDLPELPARVEVASRADTVVGELGLRMLLGDTRLSTREAKLLAAGWDGDRLRAVTTADGRVGVMWRSVWDRDEDAEEARRWLKQRKRSKVRREGRVVDFAWSRDLVLRRALDKALEAHPQAALPAADDAASAAAVAARIEAAEPDGPHVLEGRWIHPELGLSMDAPPDFTPIQRGGVPMLSADPDSQMAPLVNVGSVRHHDNPAVETEEQRAESAARAAAELRDQMGIEADCTFVRVDDRWALDTSYTLELGPTPIRARSLSFFRGERDVLQIVVTALAPVERWEEWEPRLTAILMSVDVD